MRQRIRFQICEQNKLVRSGNGPENSHSALAVAVALAVVVVEIGIGVGVGVLVGG